MWPAGPAQFIGESGDDDLDHIRLRANAWLSADKASPGYSPSPFPSLKDHGEEDYMYHTDSQHDLGHGLRAPRSSHTVVCADAGDTSRSWDCVIPSSHARVRCIVDTIRISSVDGRLIGRDRGFSALPKPVIMCLSVL